MNNKIIYINDNEAMVSKKFEKNARVFGTPEFKLWREYLRECPNAKMITKSIKKNPNKKTYKNLTYPNMRLYIREQENAKELEAEFDKEIRMSKIQLNPYKAVLAWFLQKFENYDSYKKFFKELEEKDNEKNNEKNNENEPDEETTNVNIENIPSAVNE